MTPDMLDLHTCSTVCEAADCTVSPLILLTARGKKSP